MSSSQLRRFAPFGLYLAGLAALVAIGLYIVERSWNLPLQIALAVIVIGLAVAILFDPRGALQALTGRQARYGSNALLMSLAVIGILVVINYLGNTYSKRWDLTEDKNNSLAPETIKTLNALKEPVKAEAFFSASNSYAAQTAKDLLDKYKSNSNGKFTYEIIDPETNPTAANADKVTVRDAGGTIVLKQGTKMEQVTSTSEEEVTGALVRLINPGKRTVYFLTGHGEYPLDTSSDNNFSQASTALQSKNYTVKSLNLLQDNKIPDDALAIIVAGAMQPLSPQEVDLIKAYQAKGGALVYLAEPTPATKFGDQPDPLADYLKTTWGITLDNDLIIDPNPQTNQPLLAVGGNMADFPITKSINMALIMPTARSVEASKQPPANITLTTLTTTSNQAWGETDFNSLNSNNVSMDPTKDIVGPVPLAVAGVNSQTKSRVLVVGDSDFASSKAFTRYGNSDFLLNGIDWAAQQDNLIGLTPRTPTQRFVMAPQGPMVGLMLLGTIFVIPGAVIASGVIVWLQRRRRG